MTYTQAAILGAIIGIVCVFAVNESHMSKCEAANNVQSCVMKAVPVPETVDV